MRQAGRYMKEYRDLRAKHDFLTLCKDPALAAQITVDAVERLGVDAAIIFSDILVILEPMGLDLQYRQGDGPVIRTPVRRASDVRALREVDPAQLEYVMQALRLTRRALKSEIPLIGFSAAPFTLASYMIEGGSSKHFLATKQFFHGNPALWAMLMGKVTRSLVRYLNAQIAAGAQAVQIFDSWVGTLSAEDYRRYALPWSQALIRGVKKTVPLIHFSTGTSGYVELIQQAGGDVLGLDWRTPLDHAWKRLGAVAVQGNLDPAVLLADPPSIKREARRILKEAAGRRGHIFNLGHGVLPGTPVDHVRRLVDWVQNA
jgi:uroporphyrinogen decarboxylase